MPEIHDNFSAMLLVKREDCPHDDITLDQVLQRFSKMKVYFVRMKADYEKSGNGEGQPADFDSSGKVIIDGSRLKNFLQGLKSHMLYFWKCLDDQQILEHAMSTLENGGADSMEPIPTLEQARQKKRAKLVASQEQKRAISPFQNQLLSVLAESKPAAALKEDSLSSSIVQRDMARRQEQLQLIESQHQITLDILKYCPANLTSKYLCRLEDLAMQLQQLQKEAIPSLPVSRHVHPVAVSRLVTRRATSFDGDDDDEEEDFGDDQVYVDAGACDSYTSSSEDYSEEE